MDESELNELLKEFNAYVRVNKSMIRVYKLNRPVLIGVFNFTIINRFVYIELKDYQDHSNYESILVQTLRFFEKLLINQVDLILVNGSSISEITKTDESGEFLQSEGYDSSNKITLLLRNYYNVTKKHSFCYVKALSTDNLYCLALKIEQTLSNLMESFPELDAKHAIFYNKKWSWYYAGDFHDLLTSVQDGKIHISVGLESFNLFFSDTEDEIHAKISQILDQLELSCRLKNIYHPPTTFLNAMLKDQGFKVYADRLIPVLLDTFGWKKIEHEMASLDKKRKGFKIINKGKYVFCEILSLYFIFDTLSQDFKYYDDKEQAFEIFEEINVEQMKEELKVAYQNSWG
jgi:hypothetical protein